MKSAQKTLPIRLWLGLALVLVVGMPVLAMTVMAALSVREQRDLTPAVTAVREAVTDNVGQWTNPTWQAAIQGKLVAAGTDVVLYNKAGQEVFRSVPDPLGPPAELRDGTHYTSMTIEGQAGTPATFVTSAQSDTPGNVVYIGSSFIRPFTQVAVTDGQQPVGTAQFFVGPGKPFAPQVLALNPFRRWLLALAGPSGLRMAAAGIIALLITAGLVAWFLGRALLGPLAATSRAARAIAAGNLDFTLPASHVQEVAEVGIAFRAMGEALRASLTQQEAVEQERRYFIAAIVHDLRTPLFSLRGYLDGLIGGIAEPPAMAAKYLTVCREKAAVLDRLVTDLFAYARTEYLDQPIQTEPVELGALLRTAVDGAQRQAEEKAIGLTSDDPETPCTAPVDAHLVTRAVENVLDNALRYTPIGGTVRVRWRQEGDKLTFTVADSGPGIAPDDMAHLFTPLFRGEASRNRRTGGVGLGLTIARRILQAHGGDLTAANGPDGGAIFTGRLPIRAGSTEGEETRTASALRPALAMPAVGSNGR